jgi:hypothetical protein
MSDNLKPATNKDIFDSTPSKPIHDFMAPNDSSNEKAFKTQNYNNNLNFKGAIDTVSIDEDNNSSNVFDSLSKGSRSLLERQTKKSQERSASSISGSQNASINK